MFKQNVISPQYLRSGKIAVTIIEAKDPAHYVVKECPSIGASLQVIKFIEVEETMQNYYRSVESSFSQIPLKDTIVVVLVNKKFFRAQVQSILNTTTGYTFRVYLLDYGTKCIVPRSCLYEINSDFLAHPFQAITFKLFDVEPISLVMNSTDLTLSYGPVDSWDSSAVSYITNIKRDLEEAHIEVKGVAKHMLVGSLYVTLCDGQVICVNDELIGKQFARAYPDYSEQITTLENYMQHWFRSPTPCAKLPIYSSSESISSTGSSLGYKEITSKEISKNCEPGNNTISNNQTGRRMTGRIAVDVDELNRVKDVSSSQGIINKVSKSNNNYSHEDKCHQIKSSLVSAYSDLESVKSHQSSVNLEFSNLSLPESYCSDRANDLQKKSSGALNVGQDTLNKDIERSSIKSPSQNAQSKLDTIKKFLSSKRKSTSPNANYDSKSESSSFSSNQSIITETPKNNFMEETGKLHQNIVSSEKCVKSVLSDVDNPGELLQCGLNPDRKKGISSETAPSRVKDVSSSPIITNQVSVIERSPIKSSSQNTHLKLDTIKKFLSSKRKSTSPNAKYDSISENSSMSSNRNTTTEIPKGNIIKESEKSHQNDDSLEKFVKSVMSDGDDPDDLLQCALDPDKKANISSDNESSRYVSM